ncbi:MAG: immunoglobulin domain-containing protein [Bacteroidales bacterium]|nr:immunoglobulin domain-containing protein [Bacteroidales bacterium]
MLSDCKAEKAVSVTLLDPPSIKQQPAALTLCPGEKATFTVDAESSTPLTYQWYKNDIIIDGATNIQYSISNTLYADTGFYYCKVSNKCGDSLSLKVKLKLNKTLEFILKLTAQSKCEGDTVTFKVMLTGTEPLTYRWKFNNIEINGATNDSLTLYSLSKQENEGIYSCDISNICSKLNTEAFLTVNTPPLLSTIALNQSKCVGESIEYSLSPNGTEPFGFQWKKDNIDIPGASDSRFSIINIQLPDTGQYSCVVQNLCGTTLAEVANLTINPLPYFSLGRDTVISTEDTLVLAGELQKTYLWNDNSTNSTLTITGPLTEPGTYIYSLTVTDNNGCSAADTIQVAVSFIENKFNISGKVTYNNKVETPMRDTKLILINEAGEKVDSVITNNDGSYLFEKVKKGFYTISATTTMKWGGSNPIDALLINRKFLGMYSFIDKLCEKAADVNNDKTANPIDALFINRRFINIIKKFPVSDWIFENIEFNVINSDIELNIKSICAGDVNRSYPSN